MVAITRKRALELAQECIQKQMSEDYPYRLSIPKGNGEYTSSERYAELAAALAYIENMARQKELGI